MRRPTQMQKRCKKNRIARLGAAGRRPSYQGSPPTSPALLCLERPRRVMNPLRRPMARPKRSLRVRLPRPVNTTVNRQSYLTARSRHTKIAERTHRRRSPAWWRRSSTTKSQTHVEPVRALQARSADSPSDPSRTGDSRPIARDPSAGSIRAAPRSTAGRGTRTKCRGMKVKSDVERRAWCEGKAGCPGEPHLPPK